MTRHILYPVLEAATGRDTMRCWRALEESQWFDAGRLADIQGAKLHQLVEHAVEQTAFYGRRFEEASIDVTTVQSIRDLADLPLLTKDDVRAERERMVARSHCRELISSCTSGSTGSPLIFSVGRRRCQADVASRLMAHNWFGIQPGDPGVYLWGSRIEIDNHDRLKAVRDWLINEKLLSAFELSDERLQRYADYFLRVRPHYVYSYASSMWRFAQFVRECRPDLKGVVKKVAFASGEQMLPDWREEIIQALECSVAEEYGCREGGLIAHECPEGIYHIMAPNVIVEILDDAGRSLPAGEVGRIVVTHMESYAMPFIRYDTGDTAALGDGHCPCGRGLPTMQRPTGRTFEFLEAHDGTRITGVSISRDLKEVDGVSQYRVIQEATDRVRVMVVTNFRYSGAESESQIRRRVKARIGPQTSVEIEYVDALPPHPSGKYHYVVNAIEKNRHP